MSDSDLGLVPAGHLGDAILERFNDLRSEPQLALRQEMTSELDLRLSGALSKLDQFSAQAMVLMDRLQSLEQGSGGEKQTRKPSSFS